MATDSTDPGKLADLKTASRMAPGRDGSPAHVATLTRWIVKGTRLRDGTRLRLEAVRTPGGWRTCRQWVEAFLRALTEDRLGPDDGPVPPAPDRSDRPVPPLRRRTDAQRRADSARAGELLAAMGA